MSVVIETTLGDITVDLFLQQRPVTCLNFLKLCKMKYYNYNLFHSIRSGFIAQTGDPTGEGSGGESIFGILEGPEKRFFSGEKLPKIRHTNTGTLAMVCTGENMVGSQFFFTLAPDLDSLDGIHIVIGEVTEGHDVLRKLNDVICDEKYRPYRDVRITHTVILEDPYNDPPSFRAPSRSPSPSAERLKGGRIAPDEDIDETQGKSAEEIQEMIEDKEAKARATILEIVGDLPDADIAPPENVLFVCKLNPVTTDEDLEIIFSRFGKIVSCEVIRDKKTGDSLQYAFIEFSDKKSCEEAYFKMDNVLIDDRRIHVDFSQSVSRMRWLGKGRGVQYFNEDGSSERSERDAKDSRDKRKGRDYDRDHKNGNLDRHIRHEHNKETNRQDRRHREENDRHQRDISRSKTKNDDSEIRSRREKSRSESPDTSRKHRNGDDRKQRRSNSRDNSSRYNKSTSRSRRNEDSHRNSNHSEKGNIHDSEEYSKNTEKSRNVSNNEPHKKPRDNKEKYYERQRKESPISDRTSKKRERSRSRSKGRHSHYGHRNQEYIKPRDRTVSENSSLSTSELPKERQKKHVERTQDDSERVNSLYDREHENRKKKHDDRKRQCENLESKYRNREKEVENREGQQKNREREHEERGLEDRKRKHENRDREHEPHVQKYESHERNRETRERKCETPVIDKKIRTGERSPNHSIERSNNNVSYKDSRESPQVTSKSKYRQVENSQFESPDVETLHRRTEKEKSPSKVGIRDQVNRDHNSDELNESLDKNHGNFVNEQDVSRKRQSNLSKFYKSESKKLSKNRGDFEEEQMTDKPKKTKVEDQNETKTAKTLRKGKEEKELDKKKNRESNIKKKKVVETKPNKKIVKKKRKASTSSSDSTDSSDTDSSSSSSSSSDDNRRKKVLKRRKKKVSSSSSSSSSTSSTTSSSESSSSTSSSSDSEPSKKKKKKVTSSKIKTKKLKKKF